MRTRRLEINGYNKDNILNRIKRKESINKLSLEVLDSIDLSEEQFPLLELEKYIKNDLKKKGVIVKIKSLGYGVSNQSVDIKEGYNGNLFYIEDDDGNKTKLMELKDLNKVLAKSNKDYTFCRVYNEQKEEVGTVIDKLRLYREKPKRISKIYKLHGYYNRYFLILAEED